MEFEAGRPLLMGILNVTPDSFSDGGSYLTVGKAVEHALRMVEEGAAVIDIGGESTRPGYTAVDAGEEIARVVPVISALKQRDIPVPLSVDTTKAAVARAALAAGAAVVNDVSALADPAMPEVLRCYRAGCVVMHCRQLVPGVAAMPQIIEELGRTIDLAVAQSGLPREFFMADPGIGFGKSDAQIFSILRDLDQLHQCGTEVLLGVSRKSFIGRTAGVAEPQRRLPGTLAVAVECRCRCQMLRVHDVAAHRQALEIAASIQSNLR